MTLESITAMIASTGLPYAYDRFPTPQSPPYIAYMLDASDNFFADGEVYQRIERLSIELYADAKTPALEKRVREALRKAALPYETRETWIESERMYEVVFTTEVALDESEESD